MSMSLATFPHLGPIRGEDVQPWHYRMEAEQTRWEAERLRAHVSLGAYRHFKAAAERFESIAERHSWIPSALREKAMREGMRRERRAARPAPPAAEAAA